MKLNLEKIKANLKSNQNTILLFLAILGIFITIILVIDGMDIKINKSTKATAEKSIKYLNETILQDGQTATLLNFGEESGLVKIRIEIAGKEYDSYVTKDNKLFFPEGLKMESEEDKIIAQ